MRGSFYKIITVNGTTKERVKIPTQGNLSLLFCPIMEPLKITIIRTMKTWGNVLMMRNGSLMS